MSSAAKLEEQSVSPEPKKEAKKRKEVSKKPSKRYQLVSKKVVNQSYSLENALALVKELATAKFDEAVEVHIRLGIDPTQTSEQVRTSVQMPHGTGKKIKALVFAEGDAAQEAVKKGATLGNDEIVAQIEKGRIAFDLVISTPEFMPKIAKLARILGVRGLMPNPKAGTVTNNVSETLEARNNGLVDLKNEGPLLQAIIGKASFELSKLKDNFQVLHQAVKDAKPPKTSSEYIRSITVSSTMGPGIRIDLEKQTKA